MKLEDDLVAELQKMSGCFEMYQIHHFQGYRINGAGHPETIKIELSDAGPEKENRFQATALGDSGYAHTGNPARTPREAFAKVHWDQFSAPGSPEQFSDESGDK